MRDTRVVGVRLEGWEGASWANQGTCTSQGFRQERGKVMCALGTETLMVE